jgi:hydroxyacylglutathione hydrolase
MSLEIQMLGTGNAFAKKYFNNNALLYYNHFTLLIDCGITAPLAFYTLDKHYNEIDGILITHLHGDHIGGIEELAYQMFYVYKKKLRLYVPNDLIEPLWENSLKGGLYNGEEGCNLHTYFNVIPLNENQPTSIQEDLII